MDILPIKPLDAADVKALRKAGRVVFRYQDGRSTLEVGNSGTMSNESEWTHVLRVGHCGTVYTRQSDDMPRHKLDSAFEMIHSAQFDPVWCTVASLLRVGDTLALHWVADAYANGPTRDKGLHADGLRLFVNRGDKKFTFILDVSVSYPNTARMCQTSPQ